MRCNKDARGTSVPDAAALPCIVVAKGEVGEMINSQDPFVRQFLHAEPDGPIAFHYPSKPYPQELIDKA